MKDPKFTLWRGQPSSIWIQFDIFPFTLLPTHYQLRNSPGGASGCHVFSNWVLEGSLDGWEWFVIAEHEGEGMKPGATEPAAIRRWEIKESYLNRAQGWNPKREKAYSQFRLVQTGLDPNPMSKR